MDLQNWLIFSSIAFVATITPGPAILLAISHSLSYGLNNTIFTILGNITGLLIMSVLSIVGLSAIILSSPMIFNFVKIIGALYLIYMGIRLWRRGFVDIKATKQRSKNSINRKKLYANGLAVALSNPKAIAFTTALFPQFITQNDNLFMQFGVLIVTFMFLSFTCIFGYAYAVQSTKDLLFKTTFKRLSKIFGAAFVVSGIVLANATHNDV